MASVTDMAVRVAKGVQLKVRDSVHQSLDRRDEPELAAFEETLGESVQNSSIEG